MLTVVTYLWGRRYYHPAHVQRLARSVAQWLTVPHQFVCLTDHLIPGVQTMREPEPGYPHKCFRRLWLFSKSARQLGDRILHLDLDMVLCGPLDALVQREGDLVIYRAGSIARQGYSLNPSVLLLRTGTQTDIWERFKKSPEQLSAAARNDGFWGSDQAVISHLRKDRRVPTFGLEDGVVSFRHIRSARLTAPPPGTCIVSFHGKRTPWEPAVQAQHPWIRTAWGEAA